mmetsp:Transcript_18525/g.41171  ORF Transcript_18525/g.41171 Transcript_18525/m.41171 type:complete len:89 (-) Transcript_18525:1482-1748(-)
MISGGDMMTTKSSDTTVDGDGAVTVRAGGTMNAVAAAAAEVEAGLVGLESEGGGMTTIVATIRVEMTVAAIVAETIQDNPEESSAING